MPYVAVCCRVLQCVAVCCSVLPCVAVCCSVLQCVEVCCRTLQCVAVCCSMLQCVAVRCRVLQCLVLSSSSANLRLVYFVFNVFIYTHTTKPVAAADNLLAVHLNDHRGPSFHMPFADLTHTHTHKHTHTHTHTHAHTHTHTCKHTSGSSKSLFSSAHLIIASFPLALCRFSRVPP